MSEFEDLLQRFGNKGLRKIIKFKIRNAVKMLDDDNWLPITKDQERWYKQLGDQKKARSKIIRRDYRQLSDQERQAFHKVIKVIISAILVCPFTDKKVHMICWT